MAKVGRRYYMHLILIILSGLWSTVTATTSESSGYLDNSTTEVWTPGSTEDPLVVARTESDFISLLLEGMDFRIRPNVHGSPVKVVCGMYIISLSSFNDNDMDYQLRIFLRQSWKDARMAYSHYPDAPEVLVFKAKTIEQIWVPDIYFPNEKEAKMHDTPTPNVALRVFPDGQITFSMRLSMTMSCQLKLRDFPLDKQECDAIIESYTYDASELVLAWDPEAAVEISPDQQLPQFKLTGIDTTNCDKEYTSGIYPCIKATFYLKRKYIAYLLQTYIPSMLIVILSWVSFWIDMRAVPARISISVVAVLTMATQLAGSKRSLPADSDLKALDVWMNICMVFVFCALIEYAFVNTCARQREEVQDIEDKESRPHGERRAKWFDKGSRVVFPLAFIIFNCVYWAVYLPRNK